MFKYFLTSFFVFLSLFARPAGAADIGLPETLVIYPAKNEVALFPGEKTIKNLTVFNNSFSPADLKISFENFSQSEKDRIDLSVAAKGGALADFLSVEKNVLSVAAKKNIEVPIEINIPPAARPGSLQGAVIVEAVSIDDKSAVKIQTRLAALFLVKIKGEAKVGGELEFFSADKFFYNSDTPQFTITYFNSGDVYLNPYGVVEIKNIFRRPMVRLEIDPWFVLPASERSRQLKPQQKLPLGFYRAEIQMNRGYEDIVDIQKDYFVILPYKKILTVLFGALAGAGLYFFIKKIKND